MSSCPYWHMASASSVIVVAVRNFHTVADCRECGQWQAHNYSWHPVKEISSKMENEVLCTKQWCELWGQWVKMSVAGVLLQYCNTNYSLSHEHEISTYQSFSKTSQYTLHKDGTCGREAARHRAGLHRLEWILTAVKLYTQSSLHSLAEKAQNIYNRGIFVLVGSLSGARVQISFIFRASEL